MLGLLDQPEVVKPQDQLYLYVYLYRNPRSREQVFEWLRGHWDYVREMGGEKTIEGYPRYMAGSARTKAEFDAWKEFFWPMKKDLAIARAVTIGEEEIKARLGLINEDQEKVCKVLKTC